MSEPAHLADVAPILAAARTVAVVGAHPDRSRPAHYVPAYLHAQGYRVIPVNGRLLGQELFGEPARATAAEIGEPVDVVDVFRASDKVPEHLDDLLAMRPRPGVVWLQQGIENEAVAAALRAVGIAVVQDRCMLADHRALGLPAVSR